MCFKSNFVILLTFIIEALNQKITISLPLETKKKKCKKWNKGILQISLQRWLRIQPFFNLMKFLLDKLKSQLFIYSLLQVLSFDVIQTTQKNKLASHV